MSLNMEEGPLKEAAIFTRAVENVFRKLIRLLLGRMTLVKLQEMIRIVYIEEAEIKLKRERPGKNVALTKLGLLTGLDTRTLNKILEEREPSQAVHEESKFLREITPECSILDYWSSNSKYLDTTNSKPLVLPMRGEHPSFESLMKATLKTRGITANSLMERLIESKSVEFNQETQTIKLLNNQFLPLKMQGAYGSLELGLAAVGNLVETIVHNLDSLDESGDSYFQRSNWTHRLKVTNLAKCRAEMRHLLSHAERDAVSSLNNYEEDDIGSDQMTAGVGFFYFEEESSIPSME